jgi:hypothetical protein
MQTKCISFSLWGDAPKYTVGAIENAKLCNTYYPEWLVKFFIAPNVPSHLARSLQQFNHIIIDFCNDLPGPLYYFKRFEAADDPNFSATIFRDADSRPSHREVEAVNEWLSSKKSYHIMRDHPHHDFPILGGMWGAKNQQKNVSIATLMKTFLSNCKHLDYGCDQHFLGSLVYPIACQDAMIHDEFFQGRQFPSPRHGLQFVGQIFDEHGFTNLDHCELLHDHIIRNNKYGPIGRQARLCQKYVSQWQLKQRWLKQYKGFLHGQSNAIMN